MDWSKVKEVRFEDGSKGNVIRYEKNKFGCDLRVIVNGEKLWVASDSVDMITNE